MTSSFSNSRGVHPIIIEECTKTFPRGFAYFLCINIFQLHECQYPTSCFVHRSQNWEVFANFRDLNISYGYLLRAPEARPKISRAFCIKTAYDVIIFKFQGGASAPPAGAHVYPGIAIRNLHIHRQQWILRSILAAALWTVSLGMSMTSPLTMLEHHFTAKHGDTVIPFHVVQSVQRWRAHTICRDPGQISKLTEYFLFCNARRCCSR